MEAIVATLSTVGAWILLRGVIRAWHDQDFARTALTEGSTRHRTLIVGTGQAGLLISQVTMSTIQKT